MYLPYQLEKYECHNCGGSVETNSGSEESL